jgi:hypothetical protein
MIDRSNSKGFEKVQRDNRSGKAGNSINMITRTTTIGSRSGGSGLITGTINHG